MLPLSSISEKTTFDHVRLSSGGGIQETGIHMGITLIVGFDNTDPFTDSGIQSGIHSRSVTAVFPGYQPKSEIFTNEGLDYFRTPVGGTVINHQKLRVWNHLNPQ
jgi:hypothetical protein